jgi:hypothetical protein
MTERNRITEAKSQKKRRLHVEPTVVVELTDDLAGLAQLSGGPAAAAGDGTIVAQDVRLGDGRLQTAQRRALAARIGQLQGNHHLQRAVASLKRDAQAAPYQSNSGNRYEAPTDHPVQHEVVRPEELTPASVQLEAHQDASPGAVQRTAEVPGLPANRVRQAEANLTSNPQAAVNAVVQGLVDRGQVNLSYLAGGRVTYVSDRSRMPRGHYGHTSLSPGTGHPRPCRVIVGPDAMRNVGLLYTTIMHEYQHVLQFRTSGRGVAEAVDEVEARLWEVEHLEDSGLWRDIQYMAVLPGQLQHWWGELTPTQQTPLRARYRAAQATIQEMNRRRLEEQFRQQTAPVPAGPAQRRVVAGWGG